MSDIPIKRRRLTDYQPDPHNANLGSERGQALIDQSIQEVGATRSLVAAADDTIPIGNHAMQALVDAGIVDVIEVETDGRAVVVVKRSDWASVDAPHVRRAAFLDNRTSEVSLNWDVDRIVESLDDGIDLSDLWRRDELDALAAQAVLNEAAQYTAMDVLPDYGVADEAGPERRQNAGHFPLAIVLSAADRQRWRAIKERVGYRDDTRAFLALLDAVEGIAEGVADGDA